jgi:hypothetical protein
MTAHGCVIIPTDPDLARQAVLYTNNLVDGTRVHRALTLSAGTIRQEQLTNAILCFERPRRRSPQRGYGVP